MRADCLASLHRTLGLRMGLRKTAVLGLGDTHIRILGLHSYAILGISISRGQHNLVFTCTA
jgi:hypothetical protein